MRGSRVICLFLAALLLLAAPAAAAEDIAGRGEALLSVKAGELLEFSAADLERRLGMSPGVLQGAVITALPGREYGGLFLDGVELEVFEFLDRNQLNRLCFAAGEQPGITTMGILPQAGEGRTLLLQIRVTDSDNRPPELEGLSLETGRNVAAFGRFAAADPDGDTLTIQLVKPPKKGQVQISGLRFVYEPYHNQTGKDSFAVCAVDSLGAYSPEVTVDVSIQKQKRDFYYTDMVIHPSQYAALMLHEKGVYTGKQIGSSYFFQPEEAMTRGEFLVLLLNSAGYADTMTPTVNSGLPGDEDLPVHLKRYLKKAVEERIISPDLAFAWDKVPTRAECVVLTARAARIGDVKDYPLSMADVGELPHWSVEAYRDLSAYRMLDLYDGFARPQQGLTNAYAADLLWQLYKHLHR